MAASAFQTFNALNAPNPGAYSRVLYVGSIRGAAGVDGLTYNKPFATLAAALDSSKVDASDRGTLIVVQRGHTESISAADYFSATGSKKRITIVGEGEGIERPALTWTAATSTWLMDTDSVVLQNCRLFLAGANAAGSALTVAAPITVSGNGCAIKDCEMYFGFDADQIITVGITVTGDDFTFTGNRCFGAVAAEITAAGTFLRLTGADRAVIRNNYIAGALATDTDGLIETLTTLSSNIDITGNYIYACGAGNTCAIDAGADLVNTGRIMDNLLVVDADATAGTVVLTQHANSNFALLDNFLVNNNGERGLVIGTASV